ncbi:MAG: hypothetical protein YPKNTGVA_002282 [Candidatus Fervidibacter sp.]
MRQRGYTLMECLIAIGIGIALIGIGTAVYFTVRDRAYQTMCASNLRQIYDAAKMYSLDHDGFLPPYHNSWWCTCPIPTNPLRGHYLKRLMKYYTPTKLLQAFAPYTKDTNIWFCPSDHNARQNILCSQVDRRYTSYAWLPQFFAFQDDVIPHMDFPMLRKGLIFKQMRMAADFGYGIGETCSKHPNSSYICPCNGICEGSAVPSHAHSLGHFWGVNALHWDGHVKWESWRWLMRR